VLVSLSVALLGVAFAMRDDDDDEAPVPAVRAPEEQRAPPPLVTKIRRHSPVGRFEQATCRERPYSVQDPTRWFHPTENFYPPGRDVLTVGSETGIASVARWPTAAIPPLLTAPVPTSSSVQQGFWNDFVRQPRVVAKPAEGGRPPRSRTTNDHRVREHPGAPFVDQEAPAEDGPRGSALAAPGLS